VEKGLALRFGLWSPISVGAVYPASHAGKHGIKAPDSRRVAARKRRVLAHNRFCKEAREYTYMQAGTTCPKCQGAMEEGFIPDRIGALRAAQPTEWYKDALQRSVWFGVKTLGKVHHEVRTYRCTGCGYLESYAG
jgi:hypothetical protein